jgi:hypothetical protein
MGPASRPKERHSSDSRLRYCSLRLTLTQQQTVEPLAVCHIASRSESRILGKQKKYNIYKRKRQKPGGLWRFILEDPAVLNRRLDFRLPFSQSSVCTVDRLFSLAFRPASDSRRLPISGSAFQLNLRLSSSARFPGQPSNRSPACAFNDLPAQPSGRSSTCVSDLSFQLRLPIDPRPSPPVDLPACLPTHLQLAPSANLPAQPFRSRPARAFCQRSGSAFKPNLRLSSVAAFAWRCPLVHLRPSPHINLPALPAIATSESHRSLHPSASEKSIFDLRRRSIFRPPADPTFDS